MRPRMLQNEYRSRAGFARVCCLKFDATTLGYVANHNSKHSLRRLFEYYQQLAIKSEGFIHQWRD